MPENSQYNQEQSLQEKMERNIALTESFEVQSVAIQQTEKELVELRQEIKELVDLGENENLSEGDLETLEQGIQEKIAKNIALTEEFKLENKQIQETKNELTLLNVEIASLVDQGENQSTDPTQNKGEFATLSINQELTKELEEQQVNLAKINSQIEEVDQLLNSLLDQENTPEDLIQEILYTREALIENIEITQTNLQNVTNELQNLDFIRTDLQSGRVTEETSEDLSVGTGQAEEESIISDLSVEAIPSVAMGTAYMETPEPPNIDQIEEESIGSIPSLTATDGSTSSAEVVEPLQNEANADKLEETSVIQEPDETLNAAVAASTRTLDTEMVEPTQTPIDIKEIQEPSVPAASNTEVNEQEGSQTKDQSESQNSEQNQDQTESQPSEISLLSGEIEKSLEALNALYSMQNSDQILQNIEKDVAALIQKLEDSVTPASSITTGMPNTEASTNNVQTNQDQENTSVTNTTESTNGKFKKMISAMNIGKRIKNNLATRNNNPARKKPSKGKRRQ
ncbi:hypothetical protein [Ascidiimonas sp. W6]|uniref:hypothetical protein n=1 Tax=Ascidiimonas meishanensis TaxID=3128903 RepID=UPI0030EDA54C